MTINDLKIGSKVEFGRYSCKATRDVPRDMPPVSWIKTTYNNQMLSESVLDVIIYDNIEGDRCNTNYRLSNVNQFLNSVEDNWYHPTHNGDVPPPSSSWGNTNYGARPGFLSGFLDEEIKFIIPYAIKDHTDPAEWFNCFVRLPSVDELVGDEKFPYFKRHGLRTVPTDDAYNRCHVRFYTEHIPFLTRTPAYTPFVYHIRADSQVGTTMPDTMCGLRPLLVLDPKTPVKLTAGGSYTVEVTTSEANKSLIMNLF